MIFATAMGDAYAVAWEFVPVEHQLQHDWTGYKARPQTGDRLPEPAGSFTDDTLRTLANAQVILDGQTDNPLAYVRAIKAVFRGDRRLGWSRNFQAFLESQLDQPDEAWFGRLSPRNTNGALMGAAVMGMLPSVEAVARAARVQARVTHDAEAADCAAAVALAAFAARTNACAQHDLVDFILDRDAGVSRALRAEARRTDRVDMSATRTAGAIVRLLVEARSQRAVIDGTIAMGGDTDSVAAAALGIASQNTGWFVPDLPEWMATDLEGGQAGVASRERLHALDRQLADNVLSQTRE